MNLKPVSFLATLVFATLPMASNAGTIRHDVDPAVHLAIGALPVFDSVGLFEGQGSIIGGYACSGTLVGGSWAVTAGHCVDQAESLEFTVGGETYTADGWGYHPGWLPGNLLNLIIGNDIAMVHLTDPVTNVTPAARYTGADEVGQIGFFVGYGTTGTGLTGGTDLDLQKRAGANVVDSYFFGDAVTSRTVLADFDNPLNPGDSLLGSPVPLPIEMLIAGGDSGGALFLASGDELLLAGVHSFVLGLDLVSDSDYGDIGGSTRISPYNDWIDAVLALSAGTASTSTADSGITNPLFESVFGATFAPTPGAVPIPGAIWMLMSGIGVVACRRSRVRPKVGD